ncbi:MAG: methyltransferase domain-containing protein [Planctomycetia bacterium]|nr:methyltransferase domain-containing protein [Planctomycetia bacterium]
MAVREYGRFIRESMRQPGRVGAIAPSTQRLALRMVRWIDWESANTVVEYGPGLGAFTEQILRHKRPDAKFFAVELHSEFAATLATRFPDLTVLEDSVANIESLCQQQGVSEVDTIICGLPWAAFSDRDQTVFLDAMMKVLKPGGQLATFAYLSGMVLPAAHRFRNKLKVYFSEVQASPTVWLNFPPAFIYRCRR